MVVKSSLDIEPLCRVRTLRICSDRCCQRTGVFAGSFALFADKGPSVSLPRSGKRVLTDHAAGTNGDFDPSMAGSIQVVRDWK
jgi:hypothetical protein